MLSFFNRPKFNKLKLLQESFQHFQVITLLKLVVILVWQVDWWSYQRYSKHFFFNSSALYSFLMNTRTPKNRKFNKLAESFERFGRSFMKFSYPFNFVLDEISNNRRHSRVPIIYLQRAVDFLTSLLVHDIIVMAIENPFYYRNNEC